MSTSHTRRVLIVDDDPAIRRLLSRYLKRQGFEAATARNTAEALNAVEAAPIDAVIVDIVLGKENGWEVLRKLRERSRAPILMITGAAVDEPMKGDARSLGASGIMEKPLGLEDLLRRLGELIGG